MNNQLHGVRGLNLPTFTCSLVLSYLTCIFLLIIQASIVNSEENPPLDLRLIKETIDSRCVICHGCYDAPCQLKLSSFEGFNRGASKLLVYDQSRATEEQPTRLHIDATTGEEWQGLGFHSLTASGDGNSNDVDIVDAMLNLKNKFDIANGDPLPNDFPLDVDRTLSCPSKEEIKEFEQEHPLFGMPYGMAHLPENELLILNQWREQNYPDFDDHEDISQEMQVDIRQWESFLNLQDKRHRLVARYLYEHLFLGHLHFSDHNQETYFRLVRSTTPGGEAVEELNTRHPNDHPSLEKFFYRFVQVQDSILDKTHFVYSVSQVKLARLNDLFFSSDWTVSSLPGYGEKESSNPFWVFEDIPPGLRYQFMLEDIHFFISSFIQGPVCRGQLALNVIQDRFFVAFLSPEYDLSIIKPEYLSGAKQYLGLPTKESDAYDFATVWFDRFQAHNKYLTFRENAYRKNAATKSGFSIDAIWDGEGKYNNMLTVYRHFDSATVIKGFQGSSTKTAWVIDYPTLERIYYDLVVNFDVYGNASHQTLTRVYMDYLRMESEGLFLSFLPQEVREARLANWYRGMEARIKVFWGHSNLLLQNPTQVQYQTQSYLTEFVGLIKQQSQNTANDNYYKNDARSVSNLLKSLDGQKLERQPWIHWIPEVSYIVVYDDNNQLVGIYSLLRNKSHLNVSFIFGEEGRRVPEEDTTSLVDGIVGSYPNFIFKVNIGDFNLYATELRKVKSKQSMTRFVDKFGIRRTDERIWKTIDDIHAYKWNFLNDAGLLDFSRYLNL